MSEPSKVVLLTVDFGEIDQPVYPKIRLYTRQRQRTIKVKSNAKRSNCSESEHNAVSDQSYAVQANMQWRTISFLTQIFGQTMFGTFWWVSTNTGLTSLQLMPDSSLFPLYFTIPYRLNFTSQDITEMLHDTCLPATYHAYCAGNFFFEWYPMAISWDICSFLWGKCAPR